MSISNNAIRIAMSAVVGLAMLGSSLASSAIAFADEAAPVEPAPAVEEVVEEAAPVEGAAPAEEAAPEAPAEEAVAEEPVDEAPAEEGVTAEEPAAEEEAEAVVAEEAPAEEQQVAEEAAPEVEALAEESVEETQAPAEEAAEAPVSSPLLSTEKEDYQPGETARILGNFFVSLQDVVLHILGYSPFNGDSSFEESVVADEDGSFVFDYQLDEVFRPEYVVKAFDTAGALLAETSFTDSAPASVNITQCANGQLAGPFNICKKLSGSNGYVSGNVTSSKAHFYEGDFLPYRAIVVAPNPGVQQVTLSFDTAKGSEGKHAIDYLSSFDLTETTGPADAGHANQADPCGDVIGGCDPTSPDASVAIPVPPSLTTAYPVSCAAGSFMGSPTTGDLKAWVTPGVTISGLSMVQNAPATTGDCEASFRIDYTLSGPGTVVFAWSGHIAANEDPGSGGYWGVGNAVPTGSPYHLHAGFAPQYSGAIPPECGTSIPKNACQFNVGKQDLQLASAAIVVPEDAILTLVKQVVNNNGGTASSTDWTLAANGTTPISGVTGSAAVTNAVVLPGSYDLSESGGPSGYAASDWSCVGGSQDDADTVTLIAGDNVVCTITNDDKQATITVVKEVNNNNGGIASPDDFLLTLDGSPVSSGVATPVDPGTYTADETLLDGYSFEGFSGDCDVNGDTTVALGEHKTCTLSNDDIAPKLILEKTVVNDNGGEATEDDFQAKIDGGNVDWDAENEVSVGAHTASETTLPGYSASAWGGDCADDGSVTLALGETKTCTITNDDQAGHLIVHKVTVPADDPTVFSITLDDTPVSGSATRDLSTAASVDYEVDAGTYSVSEAAEAGWDETGNTCGGIVVENGETEECTITNTKRGTIIILKDAVPNHIQDFSFTGSGSIGDFDLDDDGDVNNALPKQRSFEVAAGVYSVSEDSVSGWKLDSATCNDQSPVDAIDVAPGETVTCTFVNEKLATITLVKNTIGGDGDFDFDATGDGLPEDIDLSTVGETASTTFTNLDPDNTYSITENVPAGWVLTSASCTGTNTPDEITPNAGEHIVCTFENSRPDAHISIDPLEAVNAIHDEHVFTVTVVQVENGAPLATTTAIEVEVTPNPDLEESTTCGPAVPFVGDEATCTITINSSVVGDFVASATSTVVIGGVELVRATDGSGENSGPATKTYQAGALNITKIVAGLEEVVNGGTVDGGFTVTVTGPSYPGGHDINFTLTDGVVEAPNPVLLTDLIPGDYTVTEADAGVEWVEVAPGAPVEVVINETAEASVTNTYVPGALELSKVVELNGYLFPETVDTSFTLQVTGPSYPGGTDVVLNVVDGVPTNSPQTLQNLIPGDYTVTEEGEDEAVWIVSGEGDVAVAASTTAQKAVTNSLKIPNTTISIVPDVYETEPGQNVLLTISDTNDGAMDITNPSVELYGNGALTIPQPSYVSGDDDTDGVLDIGETWVWTVSLMINTNTEFVVNGLGEDALGNPVNGPTYESETDSVVVRVIGTTRTIGFWQTHTDFTSHVFEDVMGGVLGVGSAPHKGLVPTTAELFGGFYAPIAKKSVGKGKNAKRTPVDQARIQMLQQLLAAKLNCAAFGCSAATEQIISDADLAYAGNDKNEIKSYIGPLDSFNNSGDDGAIPDYLPATGRATPKDSKAIANLLFWDTP